MSKIPTTDGGFPEDIAVQVGTYLHQAWDGLRSLQFNKKASILRYTVTDEGKPQVGIAPTQELVADLDDLDCFVNYVSVKEVTASYGKLELSDLRFVFSNVEVKITDKILYPSVTGKQYRVVQTPHWDPDLGLCEVIGRAV